MEDKSFDKSLFPTVGLAKERLTTKLDTTREATLWHIAGNIIIDAQDANLEFTGTLEELNKACGEHFA